MKEYRINDKSYYTICSLHHELIEIFKDIKKINPKKVKTKEELFNLILKKIEFGETFSLVAKEMGQTMEDALRYRSIWGPQDSYFTFFNREGDEE